MNKLIIIDGNAVLHRAYYALPDWRNRSGEATAGVYGFLSMLFKAIDELKPTHLVVTFDTPEPTFRHNMYVGYQHGREKDRQVSEDIWGQVEKLKIVFEKMKVPVFSVLGFEADDVIGTLATQVFQGGRVEEQESKSEVIIITGDKDLMQLVNDRVKLFMPVKGMTDMVIVDRDRVREKLGINPEQVIDYKGLVGDPSDNYPGVVGIGPKTAIGLLTEYGTLDNIYKNIGGIAEKTKQKLVDGYEGAMLSQKLATIKCDVPITLDSALCGVPSIEIATNVLKELGYKSLIRRVSGEDVKLDDNQGKLFE